jgi:hypothetical protein
VERHSAEARAGATIAPEVKLGGIDATRQTPSDAVTKALAAVLADAQSQDIDIVGGSYTMPAARLADFKLPIHNDPVAQPPVVAKDSFSANVAFDAMFRVVDAVFAEEGTAKLDVDTHELECKSVSRTEGLRSLENSSEFKGVREGLKDAVAKRAFEANVHTVVEALIPASSAAEVVHCHWTNTDDEDANALLSVDREAGTISALVAFSPP